MKIGNLEVYGVVYKITNLVNGKVYIGQTINGFDKRYESKGIDIERVYNYYNGRESRKNENEYINIHLLKSIKRYGLNKFNVDKVFDIAFSRNELNIKEQCWISFYNSTDINFGYNRDSGGNNFKRLNETKRKISEYQKGESNVNSIKVICLNTKELFISASDAGRKLKIIQTNICRCCIGTLNYVSSQNGEKLVFCYYNNYLKMNEYEINKLISKASNGNSSSKPKIVICVNTLKVYYSIGKASKQTNVNKGHIVDCCKGKRQCAGKLEDGTKLVWRYVENLSPEEYIKYDIENKLIELYNKELVQAV